MTEEGIVFNIQRFTIHDGPGIRTEIFLKGCPLTCKWCGNPESQRTRPEIGVYETKCIRADVCGLCLKACPRHGCLNTGAGQKIHSIDREICNDCLSCARACPADALKQWGKRLSVEQVMKTIRQDRAYYEASGGGVTISGGEPLLQPEFTKRILRQCKEEGINTCLESTFCMDWGRIEPVLPYADLLITDIKHMDPGEHQRYTGVSNERILKNLKRLSHEEKELIIRIPVIPGVNHTKKNREQTADFILKEMKNRIRHLQLLGFMRLGEEKYASLGREYPMESLKFDRDSFNRELKEWAAYFEQRGIRCIAGHSGDNREMERR